MRKCDTMRCSTLSRPLLLVALCQVAGACRSHTAPTAPPPATAGAPTALSSPAVCSGPAEGSDDGGRKLGRVARAASPPTLEGSPEPLWEKAPRYQLTAVSPEQTAPTAQDFSAHFRPLWDDGHLYLLVEVTDDMAKPFDKAKAPHHYDQCEIYFHVGEQWQTQAKWNYGGPRQYAYEAFRAPVHLKPTWKGKQADHRMGIKDGTAGWTAEIALPFSFWEFQPAVGKSFGFELHCNDGDAGAERDNHLAWSDAKNEAWRSPTVIGTLTLCD